MRRKGARKSTNIDITPLIDVLFMLIIFFVLTTSFVQGAISIDLPIGDNPPPISDRNPIVLTVTKEKELLWAGESIASADLAERVRAARARSEDILIAGDREASYGVVASLLDRLRALGVESVSLALEGGGP